MTKRRFTALDLFAGAGGLALGAERAGFNTQGVVEVEENCCETLRLNGEKGKKYRWEVYEGDVRSFKYASFANRVTLITAGVPCQPFSLGGKHKGHEDDRNMFPEAIRAVREVRPKAVLIENVKGLLRPSFRPYYEYVLLKLEMPESKPKPNETWPEHKKRLLGLREKKTKAFDLTYDVKEKLLNAADFGIPQRRERVFIVAFRSDLKVNWTFPAPSHSRAALLVSQWYDGSYWKEHGVKEPSHNSNGVPLTDLFEGAKERWRTVRDALKGLPAPVPLKESPGFVNHVGNPGARPYKGHDGSPFDEPAKTLKAGVHGVPGGENTLRLPSGDVRYFTAREAARLQTFPDDYAFAGAWTETLRQLGNAVPVDLAKLLATKIKRQLERAN